MKTLNTADSADAIKKAYERAFFWKASYDPLVDEVVHELGERVGMETDRMIMCCSTDAAIEDLYVDASMPQYIIMNTTGTSPISPVLIPSYECRYCGCTKTLEDSLALGYCSQCGAPVRLE